MGIELDTTQIYTLKGIAGLRISTLGTVTLGIQDQNENAIFYQHFHVVEEDFPIPAQGLLGNDFFTSVKAELNYSDLKLKIKGIEFSMEKISEPATNNLSLSPRSETLCEVYYSLKDDPSVEKGQEVYFVEKTSLSEHIICPSSIVKPHEGKFRVFLLNSSDETQELPIPTLVLTKIEIGEPVSPTSLAEERKIYFSTNSNSNRLHCIEDTTRMEHLNTKERQALLKVLHNYNDIFLLPGDKLSTTPAIQHRVITTTDAPIHIKPYRLPQVYKDEIDRQLVEMQEQDIIRPTDSPYNFPLLVIPKKKDASGKLKIRLAVDFRKLNEITVGESFPIANVAEILDNLSGSRYFSVIDLAAAFHQISVSEKDVDKLAFSSGNQHFAFQRMPFGLKNAPATMSRLMSQCLVGVKGLRAFAYLDDIILYSPDLERHIKDLTLLFDRLRKFNLKIQPDKCEYLRAEVTYLGHKITKEGVLPDEGKLEVLKRMVPPKNEKGIKSFVAFASYYRKFVKDFAKISQPLTKLLKKEVEFQWGSEQQAAFEKLKEALTNPPLLQYPDFTKEFMLTCDASQYSVGSVLSQFNSSGHEVPISYASKTLSEAQTRWSTIDRECYAIFWAIKHYHCYLYGRHFKIVTDHKPLVWLFNVKDPNSRLFRWRTEIAEYDFEIVYRKGVDNPADYFSRLPPIQGEGRESENIASANSSDQGHERKVYTQPGISRADDSSHSTTPDHNDLASYQTFVRTLQTKPIINFNLKEVTTNTKATVRQHQIKDLIYLTDRELTNVSNFPYPTAIDQLKTKLENNNDSLISVELQKLRIHFVIAKQNYREKLCSEETFHLLVKMKSVFQKLKINKFAIFALPEEDENRELRTMTRYIFKTPTFEIYYLTYRPEEILDNTRQEQIIKEFHGSLLSGHEGMNRTLKKIQMYYTWPLMKDQVESFVKNCTECQTNKDTRKKTKEPMQITTTAFEPFQKLNVDLMGPFPISIQGNKYILTVQCDLTKYSIAVPIPNQESFTIAEALVKEVICIYGCPKYILTDLGRNLIGTLIQDLCKLLKIKKLQTTAFRPQSNGALERSHKCYNEYLKHFISSDQVDWCSWIQFATFAYNTTPHTATKFTPFELVFGRKAVIPSALSREPEFSYTYDDYFTELEQRLRVSNKFARENLLRCKEIYKGYYDRNIRPVQFEEGDLVLLQNEQQKKGLNKKLCPSWLGPYEIVSTTDRETNVIIKKGRRLEKVHVNRLKKYSQ